VADVLADIRSGLLDADLSAIAKACRDRQAMRLKELEQHNRAQLSVGDRVFLRNIRPKYLCGLEAVITNTASHHNVWIVQLDTPAGKFIDGRVFVYPHQVRKVTP
jgi:hypothetical protein